LIADAVKKVENLFGKNGTKPPIRIKRELQKLMNQNVGIARDEKGLRDALSEIDRLQDEMENDMSISTIRRYNTDLLDAIELKNMLLCARLIATCAEMRKESRGAHLRLDYPDKDDAHWLKNIVVWKENGRLRTSIGKATALETYRKKQDA
jgi:succinate dehydrogenase/fumarate reductase flavoprotein subunit